MSKLPKYIWRATQRTFQYKDEACQSLSKITSIQTVCTEHLPHAKAHSSVVAPCRLRLFEEPLGSVTAFPDGSPIRNPTRKLKRILRHPCPC